MNKNIVLMALAALSFQANANLSTYYDLPEGKSGQYYACFDEEGYLYGYTSIRKYARLKGGNVLINSVSGGKTAEGNFEKLTTIASVPNTDLMGSDVKWDPDNLPIWIDITKMYVMKDGSKMEKNHKCRRVEGSPGYLKVTRD